MDPFLEWNSQMRSMVLLNIDLPQKWAECRYTYSIFEEHLGFGFWKDVSIFVEIEVMFFWKWLLEGTTVLRGQDWEPGSIMVCCDPLCRVGVSWRRAWTTKNHNNKGHSDDGKPKLRNDTVS